MTLVRRTNLDGRLSRAARFMRSACTILLGHSVGMIGASTTLTPFCDRLIQDAINQTIPIQLSRDAAIGAFIVVISICNGRRL